MKRILMAIALAWSFTNVSWGGLLLTDSFPTDGAPPPGWTVVSGTGGQSVVGGKLEILASGTGSGTGDYSKPLSAPVSTGKIYAGYDLVITSAPTDGVPIVGPPAVAGGDNYFAHFSTTAAGAAPFFSRVSLNLSGTDTVLGLAESTTTGSIANVFGTTPLALNTTYRIVQSYDFTLGEARVWLNPTTELDPSLADSTFAQPAGTSFAAFNFRINNTSDGNKLIDNLIVSDTFAEAAFVSAIPEPNSLFLVGMIGAGIIGIRKRKLFASN